MNRLVVSLLTLFSLAGCSGLSEKTDIPPPLEDGEVPTVAEVTPTITPSTPVDAVWSYAGAFAPQYWGDLDPSFVMCKEGKHQSPVDLKWKKPVKNNPFSTAFVSTKAKVEDTGNIIRLRVEEGSTIRMRSSLYSLQHADIHSPSEHTLSGKSFPLELQFVHKNDKDFYAIVSVFVKEGRANAAAEKIIATFPDGKNATKDMVDMLPLNDLVPAKHTLYNYAGSMTYPPCAEGVNWIVLNTPIEFSKEQIAAFEARYNKNNRPKQPLNDRALINY